MRQNPAITASGWSPDAHTLVINDRRVLERVMGIEPTPSAWKAEVLPLNYTRLVTFRTAALRCCLVEGVGFEPTKAEPADLQSAPVDRLGTPPKR